MRVLLLLNGPEGWQTGIEDGFNHLQSIGMIEKLEWFYLDAFSKKESVEAAISTAIDMSENFQPDLIVIFHIGSFPVTDKFISRLKGLDSQPILAYDEGDMYGTWAKPILKSMKTVIKRSDVVSLRGLGKIYEQIRKLNDRIIYTPHHADIARFDKEPYLLSERKNKLVLIGNKVKPRLLSSIRRMPGAREREEFVKAMGRAFPKDFVLHGNGWDGFVGNQGPVEFQKQLDVYRDSWITVAYEHYPEIPYYFSNRLPIALMTGSLYVCHYHKGYENIFKDCDFIFFFKTYEEAVDLINYIHSLSKDDLMARSVRARAFSLKYYHPNVVWKNFYNNLLEKMGYASIE
jgi:hypothetical protein